MSLINRVVLLSFLTLLDKLNQSDEKNGENIHGYFPVSKIHGRESVEVCPLGFVTCCFEFWWLGSYSPANTQPALITKRHKEIQVLTPI